MKSSRPRVLFLNRSYWPDAEATGQLLTELCEDLARTFDVTVIAGQPNQNPDAAPYRRSGAYRRRQVCIERVWHFQLPKRSLAFRALNQVTFLATALLRGMRLRRPAIVVVETDPPILPLLGRLLAWWHGGRLVVYLQDVYPDIIVALGKLKDGLLIGRLRRLMFSVYRGADRVVVLSEDMRELLTSGGVSPARIASIPNWADPAKIMPIKRDNPFRRDHIAGDRFVVMYSGNMGLTQRLDRILDAAKLLMADWPNIVVLLIGDGASRPGLERRVREEKIANVRFLDYQPRKTLAASLSAADLHVVVLDRGLRQLLMPSKVYGILAAGTAFLAAAPATSDLARLARDEGVGLTADLDDPAALADAMRWAVDHPDELRRMGERARQLAVHRFSRHAATGHFAELLAEVAARGA